LSADYLAKLAALILMCGSIAIEAFAGICGRKSRRDASGTKARFGGVRVNEQRLGPGKSFRIWGKPLLSLGIVPESAGRHP
jgi:hypothetical protein